jgi:hypothetical protein
MSASANSKWAAKQVKSRQMRTKLESIGVDVSSDETYSLMAASHTEFWT